MWDIIENKKNMDLNLLIVAYSYAVHPVIKDMIAGLLLGIALELGDY